MPQRPRLAQPVNAAVWLPDYTREVERALGSRVESGGSLTLESTPQTATGTIGADGFFFPVDATAGDVTMTLPPAASSKGRILMVKKTDGTANTVTVDGNSSETIDGQTTQVIPVQYTNLMLFCDGTEWWIV